MFHLYRAAESLKKEQEKNAPGVYGNIMCEHVSLRSYQLQKLTPVMVTNSRPQVLAKMESSIIS